MCVKVTTTRKDIMSTAQAVTTVTAPAAHNACELREKYSRRYFWAIVAATSWIVASISSAALLGATPVTAYFAVLGACLAPAIAFGVVTRLPRGFSCEHCGKYIRRDTEWICTHCDQQHASIGGLRTFFRCRSVRAQGCSKAAPGFRCHHCNSINWFVSDERLRDTRFVARQAEPAAGPLPADEKHASEIADLESRRVLAEKETQTVAAERRLNAVKNPPQPPQPKSIGEEVRVEFDQALQRYTSTDEAYVEAIERLQLKFKDHPELLEKHLDYLKELRDKII